MANIDYRQKYADWCLSQVGQQEPFGDDQYINYYNQITGATFNKDTTAWCAIFATVGARKVGIPTNVIPNFASCTTSRDSFWKPNNRWRSKSQYTPKAGDLIFFDWDLSGNCDHVEVVVDVDSSKVYTVGGNTKGGYSVDGVRKKSYSLNYQYIAGYAEPDYDKIANNDSSTSVDFSATDNNIVMNLKNFQTWMNLYINAGLVVDGSCGPLTKAAAVKSIQTCINREYGGNLAVDGSYGPATKAAVKTIQKGSTGTLVRIAQGLLYGHDIDPNGFDGSFGSGMLEGIKDFQRWAGISVDGSCGPNTWYNLNKKW